MSFIKYLNPKNDLAFKKIFGTEKNKDVLIHFLNDIITQDKRPTITDVKFLNPSLTPDTLLHKQVAVDVLCTDQEGVQYIVEMQVAKTKGFAKRAQYYTAKTYANQMCEGEAYSNLKEVIFLAITDFIMFADQDYYKSEHVVLDNRSQRNHLKDFSFTFIELPKFKITDITKLQTYEQKWCYFFKHAHEPENIEEFLKDCDNIIKKAHKQLEIVNWTADELANYENYQKVILDNKAALEQKYDEGLAKGEARGKAEGQAEGKAEGLMEGEAKGLVEGETKGQKQMVINMLQHGIKKNAIADMTGLSLEDIDKWISD